MRCEYLQNEIELRHDAAYLFWFFGIILASQREDAMDGWIGMEINYVRGVGGDSWVPLLFLCSWGTTASEMCEYK